MVCGSMTIHLSRTLNSYDLVGPAYHSDTRTASVSEDPSRVTPSAICRTDISGVCSHQIPTRFPTALETDTARLSPSADESCESSDLTSSRTVNSAPSVGTTTNTSLGASGPAISGVSPPSYELWRNIDSSDTERHVVYELDGGVRLEGGPLSLDHDHHSPSAGSTCYGPGERIPLILPPPYRRY